jgi:hypothetical protein
LSALIFIDTNIFLDFYRIEGQEAGLSILKQIDNNHGCLITSAQVEMEFKKNRQKVIIDSYNRFRSQEIRPPVFLLESKQHLAMKNTQAKSNKLSKSLKRKMVLVLKNPIINDQVYKVVQRLFRSTQALNLSKTNKIRFQIRQLAKKRFCLGYPPRKKTDTSIGDAINWEWIIHCANTDKRDVVIVSRDSDYGEFFENEAILNDWLRQEFKERVSRKRQICLTTRLTEGLKKAGIQISSKQEKLEHDFLATHSHYSGAIINQLPASLLSAQPIIFTNQLKNTPYATLASMQRAISNDPYSAEGDENKNDE